MNATGNIRKCNTVLKITHKSEMNISQPNS